MNTYHVMNRGDRRDDIYRDDKDRFCFLETLAQACEKTGWQVHAFCLMNDHFHLVVQGAEGAGLLIRICGRWKQWRALVSFGAWCVK